MEEMGGGRAGAGRRPRDPNGSPQSAKERDRAPAQPLQRAAERLKTLGLDTAEVLHSPFALKSLRFETEANRRCPCSEKSAPSNAGQHRFTPCFEKSAL
jgi:hypothetical protein